MLIINARSLFRIALLLSPMTGYSQVTIQGPDCVVPGTVYQYIITGAWDSSATAHVCITGGNIAGTTDTCTPDQAPIAFVQVTWNSGTAGRLSLQSSFGSALLDVSITSPLSGGLIMDSCKNRTIPFDSIPPAVTCAAASGGNCSPAYVYQWQLSVDDVYWEDIEGATGLQLTLVTGLQKTTYYRRKVTDSASGSIAWSDAACIIVQQLN